MDRLHVRELQDRHAREIQAHTPSRQPAISNNAGGNVKQIIVSNAKLRDLIHWIIY